MGFLRSKGNLLLLAGFVSLAPTLTQAQTNYHGRKAWKLENRAIQLLVLPGGGHIASLTLKSGAGKGVNPFWLPPWQSVEPQDWNKSGRFPAYPDAAGPLLASIMGHNICVDFFGAPSKAEAVAGVPVHGEAPCLDWIAESQSNGSIRYSTQLPKAQMKVSRTISIAPNSSALWITETVENQTAFDRPFGWQQHPTFGPPFLEKGVTFFDMPATKSMVYPKEFSKGERLKRGEEFEWPNAPTAGGDTVDLREYPKGNKNSDYTASVIDPSRKWAYVTALNTKKRVLVGYVWPRADWPWVGNWEENHFRSGKPWLGKATARGMEFGTTPWPDSRKDMVKLGTLLETPTYRWIGAKEKQSIGYGAFIVSVPAGTTGVEDVQVEGKSIKVKLQGVQKTLTFAVSR
jgi:hypothetical protein